MSLRPEATLGQMPGEILSKIASHMSHMSQGCRDGITRTSKTFRSIFLHQYIRQIIFTGNMEQILHRLAAFNAVHASSTGPIWSYVRCVRFYVTGGDISSRPHFPDTRGRDLVGDFLRKVAAVEEVSVFMSDSEPCQPNFLDLLGDISSQWPSFPKLKLTRTSAQVINAVVSRCPQSALQVARLPLHPNSDELRLLAGQCPSLKRLHVDKPGRYYDRPFAVVTWIIEDICGAFVNLEWLVLGEVLNPKAESRVFEEFYDSNTERLDTSMIPGVIVALNSAPSLVRFAFKALPRTDTLYMDVLEEILSSVPLLEELCIISQYPDSSARSALLYRGRRKPGEAEMTFIKESWASSEREQRFPCTIFGE